MKVIEKDTLIGKRIAKLDAPEKATDEVVVGDAQCLERLDKLQIVFVAQLLRSLALSLRRFLNFCPMLIHAGEEKRFLAKQSVITLENIRDDRGIAVADMQFRIGIINRSRNVEVHFSVLLRAFNAATNCFFFKIWLYSFQLNFSVRPS